MSEEIVSLDDAASRIDAVLNATTSDYMYPPNNTTLTIAPPRSASDLSGSSVDEPQALLTFGQYDARRNAPPLGYTQHSTKCFCDWRHETPHLNFPITAASSVFLRADRAHQFANACGPEPAVEHYVEMLELTSRLHSRALTVVNLAGSGASVPQHFHTQIYPLVRHDGARTENSLGKLWKNVLVAGQMFAGSDVELREVTFPLWGLQFSFSPDVPPARIGRWLYEAIHVGLRYRGQLALTYNLYVDSRDPRRVTILFRESRKECVFQLPEVLELIARVDSRAAAERVAGSPNRSWRWAWLECMGGFPARDDSFANVDVYNWEFWSRIWEMISLPVEFRAPVVESVVKSLQDLQPLV